MTITLEWPNGLSAAEFAVDQADSIIEFAQQTVGRGDGLDFMLCYMQGRAARTDLPPGDAETAAVLAVAVGRYQSVDEDPLPLLLYAYEALEDAGRRGLDLRAETARLLREYECQH